MIVTVALTAVTHTEALVTVYEMVVVPAVKPVTKPVRLTEATAALLDDQTPPVVALASVVVEPAQIAVTPVIDWTAGCGLTVTTEETDDEQPFTFVAV